MAQIHFFPWLCDICEIKYGVSSSPVPLLVRFAWNDFRKWKLFPKSNWTALQFYFVQANGWTIGKSELHQSDDYYYILHMPSFLFSQSNCLVVLKQNDEFQSDGVQSDEKLPSCRGKATKSHGSRSINMYRTKYFGNCKKNTLAF